MINKKILIILISILTIFELFFPTILWKKEINNYIQPHKINQGVDFNVNKLFYEKNYLMSNGKYVSEKSPGYIIGVVPEEILQLAEKYSTDKLPKIYIIAKWAIISNWGEYSMGNNPFFISYNDTKKIINDFPKTSIILANYKNWDPKDSTYKTYFTKIASFPNLDECFDVYTKLNPGISENNRNDLYYQSLDSLKNILNNKKVFKSTIDTTKLVLFGHDTITVNDTTKVYSYYEVESYNKVFIPNYLLLSILILFLYKIYINEKSI